MWIGYWIVEYHLFEIVSECLIRAEYGFTFFKERIELLDIFLLFLFFCLCKECFIDDPEDSCEIIGSMTSTRDESEESRWDEKEFFEALKARSESIVFDRLQDIIFQRIRSSVPRI